MTQEELTIYRAKLKQNLVLSDGDLDHTDIWKQFLKNQTINVIVSNVNDPCDFSIQLIENKNSLEQLMNDLENIYCGFGSSYYDMPEDYITNGRFCAGLFPYDLNWHRCQILDVDSKNKMAKVSYIGLIYLLLMYY